MKISIQKTLYKNFACSHMKMLQKNLDRIYNKTNNILNLQCQRSYPEAFDCRLDKEVCAYFSLHEYVIF